MKVFSLSRVMFLKTGRNLCTRYFCTLLYLHCNVDLLLAVFVVVNATYIRIRGKGASSNVTLWNDGWVC